MGNIPGRLQKLNKDTLVCLVCILNVEYICSCCFAFAKLKLQKGNPFLFLCKTCILSTKLTRIYSYLHNVAIIWVPMEEPFQGLGRFVYVRSAYKKHFATDFSECVRYIYIYEHFCIIFLALFLRYPRSLEYSWAVKYDIALLCKRFPSIVQ